tara:strand:+ start:152 stop:436 length:285 start_codon:yes stop_codon:yes gene_type:complete
MELPDELWEHIKDFTFDWKRSHKQKLQQSFVKIKYCYYSYLLYSSEHPPWSEHMMNLSDTILKGEPLVEIEKKPNDSGWLYHFGWSKKTGRELD